MLKLKTEKRPRRASLKVLKRSDLKPERREKKMSKPDFTQRTIQEPVSNKNSTFRELKTAQNSESKEPSSKNTTFYLDDSGVLSDSASDMYFERKDTETQLPPLPTPPQPSNPPKRNAVSSKEVAQVLSTASEDTKNILSVIFSKNYETISCNSTNTKSKKNILKYPYKDLTPEKRKRNYSEKKKYGRGLTMTYSSRLQNIEDSKYLSKYFKPLFKTKHSF
jgi:hypothetical protein